MEWSREPFYGGCSYYSSNGDVVTGRYSPHSPLEFESDCNSWTLNSVGNYRTAQEAMTAAEQAA